MLSSLIDVYKAIIAIGFIACLICLYFGYKMNKQGKLSGYIKIAGWTLAGITFIAYKFLGVISQ